MDIQINEINGVYQIVLPTPFSVGPINVYLIKGDVVTLVDMGPKTKEAWAVFCESLKQINLKPEDIEQVVLTHHHPDHVGLLQFMPENLTVVGHPKNNPWLNKSEDFIKLHDDFFMTYFKRLGVEDWMHLPVIESMKATLSYACDNRVISHEVHDGDLLRGLEDWKILETPGHAGSHIALYREKDGLMMAGDLIIEHVSSNPLVEPPYPGESERAKALLQYHESLRKCLQLDINLVLAGHGRNVENCHALIDMRMQKQEERMSRVYEWLKEKPLTAFEISELLYPTLYKKELGLTLSVAVGQLDLLEERNLIAIDKANDVWKFFAC
ncbi:MBL fold metallo-hydrolase [Calidifontibacillus oryziterrae]|uniref:MBL fold metallo-hydrolase n=1 Tax=Calidifontibacillus oryziterrae TaxID=1191699 RepID=UPI0003083525|nr:MBL fold metallo-hydrolase [Calidifontibacillus oryziterrae]